MKKLPAIFSVFVLANISLATVVPFSSINAGAEAGFQPGQTLSFPMMVDSATDIPSEALSLEMTGPIEMAELGFAIGTTWMPNIGEQACEQGNPLAFATRVPANLDVGSQWVYSDAVTANPNTVAVVTVKGAGSFDETSFLAMSSAPMGNGRSAVR